MHLFETIDLTSQTYQKMRKRGIRVMPGGDYGFIWNPIGTNARDFELFVKLFGYTPAEVLSSATMLGGQIMDIQIGRASCRERVCQNVSISVVAVSLKKK